MSYIYWLWELTRLLISSLLQSRWCDLPNFTIFREYRKDGLGGGVQDRVIEPQVPV